MKLTLTPWSGEPATLVYEGRKIKVRPYGDSETDWMAKLGTYKAAVAWSALSEEEQASYSGAAMCGTMCVGFESFAIPTPDGKRITVTYDGESDDERFATQGEQLLADDSLLRAAVFNFALKRSNFRDEMERETVGES